MIKKNFFWNLCKFIIIMSTSLIMTSVPLFAIEILDKFHASTLVQNLVSVVFLAVVLLFVRYLWIRLVKYDTANVVDEKMRAKDYLIGIGFFAAILIVSFIGDHLNEMVLGVENTSNTSSILEVADSALNLSSWAPFALFLIIISIFAPILEELVFRVYLTNKFFLNSKGLAAGIVSSVIFGALHGTKPIEFLMYTFFGYIFFLAYRRRGNAKDSMLVHILNNCSASIVFLWTTFMMH